jgi:hypothetical protein
MPLVLPHPDVGNNYFWTLGAIWCAGHIGGEMATTLIAIGAQCDEKMYLRSQLAQTIKSLVKAHISYHAARMISDPEVAHLEVVLDAADAKWKQARQSYLEHRKAHGC